MLFIIGNVCIFVRVFFVLVYVFLGYLCRGEFSRLWMAEITKGLDETLNFKIISYLKAVFHHTK